MINIKNWLFVIIVSGACLLGVIIGRIDTKPQPKPTQAVDLTKWRDLKAIDDRALQICGQGFRTVSNIFEAQTKLDTKAVDKNVKDLEGSAEEMSDIAVKRQEALKKLGY